MLMCTYTGCIHVYINRFSSWRGTFQKIKVKDPPPAKKEKKADKAAAADKKGDKKEEAPKPMTSAEAKNKLQKVGQIMSVRTTIAQVKC